jgi:hypothetical protein
MHFDTKNTLKSNNNHTPKQAIKSNNMYELHVLLYFLDLFYNFMFIVKSNLKLNCMRKKNEEKLES